jgi:hypothetical protein
MDTYSIIVPIDKQRNMQFLKLLQLLSKKSAVTMQEINKTIPRSTFTSLDYKLRNLNLISKQKYGFDLFVYKKFFDIETRRENKILTVNAKMDVIDIEGSFFVEFVRRMY